MPQPGEHYRIRDEVRSINLQSLRDAQHKWNRLGTVVAAVRDDLERARQALMAEDGGWTGAGADRFGQTVDQTCAAAAAIAGTASTGVTGDDSGSAFQQTDPDRNMSHQLAQLVEDVEDMCREDSCPGPLPDKPWHSAPTWTWGEHHRYVGPVEWGHKYQVKANGSVLGEYSPEQAQFYASQIGAGSPDGLSGAQIDQLLEVMGYNDLEYRNTVQTAQNVAERFNTAATSLPPPVHVSSDQYVGTDVPGAGGGGAGGGVPGGGVPGGGVPGGGVPGGGGASVPAGGVPTGGVPSPSTPIAPPSGDTGSGGAWSPGEQVPTPGAGGPGTGSPGVGSPGVGSPGVGSPGVGSPGVGSPGVGSPGTGTPGAGDVGGGGDLWDEDDWEGAGLTTAGAAGGPGSSVAGIGGGSGGVPSSAGASGTGGLGGGAGAFAGGAAVGAGGMRLGAGGAGVGGAATGGTSAGGVGAAGGMTGGAGGTTGAAGGAAGGRAGMAPMMPMGGAGGAGGRDGDRSTWLEEDEDVWGLDQDTPPPVIDG